MHEVRLRSWDHFPVITKIEERALRTKKGVKGWAVWAPKSQAEKSSFKNLFSAHEVTVFHVMTTEDWSLCSRGQGHYDCFTEQEQILCAGRDQGYGIQTGGHETLDQRTCQ